ncbi:MAG: hypothetical protein QME74_10845, partial [Candidatus Edwardsbacteria bacterium]|nr:hypothetical protein [Candidatus Edwardsbacteria bacterium]
MSRSGTEADPRILGQLLAAQSTFSVFSVRQRMGEFVCRAVEGIPGVGSCAVCMPGTDRPLLGGEPIPECAVCDVPKGDIERDPGHPCRLPGSARLRILPLRTQERHFGFALIEVKEPEQYGPYEPFVGNLIDGLAVNIERQWQKDRLHVVSEDLLKHRDHLQEIIGMRTAELQNTNDRLQHLNAVLCSIRGVNQIIVREGKIERLVQSICECLIETRCYDNAWIALA